MPMIGDRFFANPAFGRALEQARMADEDERNREDRARDHGHLKHVEVHPHHAGGFTVHAHFRHPQRGDHVVITHHADSDDAGHAVRQTLRRHEG